jgi:hypothetical protein
VDIEISWKSPDAYPRPTPAVDLSEDKGVGG